uniref:Uncharacterized protein n=1 Tax=Chromera velia CCMP2878 TaxID=1169474 RepID=A0A0G4FX17_9ALVE|eukprot:Cvel_19158.t1-p1 / transcript=Cvel_19158.t1 / gene=Cvel_19158 / organism=Chromera_velia_CCMP2878 / gene_product=hypothetical protein / transcript_product=hypothetical protein / location=Cvel_scaffold1631:25616-29562(-) / protein_length=1026 / sequence_SO=supercontig / SO=protein_coding / is_pseudo=false
MMQSVERGIESGVENHLWRDGDAKMVGAAEGIGEMIRSEDDSGEMADTDRERSIVEFRDQGVLTSLSAAPDEELTMLHTHHVHDQDHGPSSSSSASSPPPDGPLPGLEILGGEQGGSSDCEILGVRMNSGGALSPHGGSQPFPPLCSPTNGSSPHCHMLTDNDQHGFFPPHPFDSPTRSAGPLDGGVFGANRNYDHLPGDYGSNANYYSHSAPPPLYDFSDPTYSAESASYQLQLQHEYGSQMLAEGPTLSDLYSMPGPAYMQTERVETWLVNPIVGGQVSPPFPYYSLKNLSSLAHRSPTRKGRRRLTGTERERLPQQLMETGGSSSSSSLLLTDDAAAAPSPPPADTLVPPPGKKEIRSRGRPDARQERGEETERERHRRECAGRILPFATQRTYHELQTSTAIAHRPILEGPFLKDPGPKSKFIPLSLARQCNARRCQRPSPSSSSCSSSRDSSSHLPSGGWSEERHQQRSPQSPQQHGQEQSQEQPSAPPSPVTAQRPSVDTSLQQRKRVKGGAACNGSQGPPRFCDWIDSDAAAFAFEGGKRGDGEADPPMLSNSLIISRPVNPCPATRQGQPFLHHPLSLSQTSSSGSLTGSPSPPPGPSTQASAGDYEGGEMRMPDGGISMKRLREDSDEDSSDDDDEMEENGGSQRTQQEGGKEGDTRKAKKHKGEWVAVKTETAAEKGSGLSVRKGVDLPMGMKGSAKGASEKKKKKKGLRFGSPPPASSPSTLGGIPSDVFTKKSKKKGETGASTPPRSAARSSVTPDSESAPLKIPSKKVLKSQQQTGPGGLSVLLGGSSKKSKGRGIGKGKGAKAPSGAVLGGGPGAVLGASASGDGNGSSRRGGHAAPVALTPAANGVPSARAQAILDKTAASGHSNIIPIHAKHLESGTVRVFPSLRGCADSLSINAGTISRALKFKVGQGGASNITGGWCFNKLTDVAEEDIPEGCQMEERMKCPSPAATGLDSSQGSPASRLTSHVSAFSGSRGGGCGGTGGTSSRPGAGTKYSKGGDGGERGSKRQREE